MNALATDDMYGLLGKEAGFSRTQRIFAWLVCLGVACITAEC